MEGVPSKDASPVEKAPSEVIVRRVIDAPSSVSDTQKKVPVEEVISEVMVLSHGENFLVFGKGAAVNIPGGDAVREAGFPEVEAKRRVLLFFKHEGEIEDWQKVVKLARKGEKVCLHKQGSSIRIKP